MNDETLEKVAAQIPQGSPTRIETQNFVLNIAPRISAAKLAEYVVADHARQETIAKQAKRAPKAIMIPYSRVRDAVPDSLGANGLAVEFLLARAKQLEATECDNDWQQRDMTLSALALGHLAKIAPKIELEGAEKVPVPRGGWGALTIEGVRVSVQPEVVFSTKHRGGVTKIGAIILNTGKGENLSLGRAGAKFKAGDYLTVLLLRMLATRLKTIGMPLHTKCYAIDIFREEVYTAPASYKTLLKHIEAACRSIVRQWKEIPLEVSAETASGLTVRSE
jgi:hypothetical protein